MKGGQLPTAFFTVSLPPHVASLGALGQHCGWAALWSADLGFSSGSGDAGPGQELKIFSLPIRCSLQGSDDRAQHPHRPL